MKHGGLPSRNARFNPYNRFMQMNYYPGTQAYSEFEHLPENPNEDLFRTPFSVLTQEDSPGQFTSFTKTLEHLLIEDFKLVEKKGDKEKKEDALLKLNDILKTWMDQVNSELLERDPTGHPVLKDPKSQIYQKKYTSRLLCFGSYKLGVSTPTGDIDALVLAPSYVERDRDFFGTLYQILQGKARFNDQITDLTFVNYEHSITPLIKMEFYDVSVDLVFAHIEDVSALDGEVKSSGLSDRPNLANNHLLRLMDDKMKRSYNGFRNAEMILNSIVDAKVDSERAMRAKIGSYRTFLRLVKLWAKRKGVNENKFGFLGGIALAILCAKIFQLHPKLAPLHLLERFLYIFSHEWDWDKWPVKIVEDISEDFGSGSKPTLVRQRFMYIMTPAWPQMNSSYNVSFSSREVMLKMMRESHKALTAQLETGALDVQRFYLPFEFFREHDQYLEITIVGREEDQFLLWKGYIEAKLRYLTEELENLMNFYDFMIQVWPRTYAPDEIPIRKKYLPKWDEFPLKEKLYIGLSLESEYECPIDLRMVVKKFLIRIEKGWAKENPPRDAASLNVFIYILERSDISREGQRESIEKSPNLDPKNLSFKKHEKSLKHSAGKDKLLVKRSQADFEGRSGPKQLISYSEVQIKKPPKKCRAKKDPKIDILDDLFG